VAFHGVDDRQPRGPETVDQALYRRHDQLDPRYVVAEALAEASRLREIALHVDDDQCQ